LNKDPKDRVQKIGDARVEIGERRALDQLHHEGRRTG
jgi:hypothetical protein